MNVSAVMPRAAGMCLPICFPTMPPKMTSVARPRIFGPMTLKATEIVAMMTTIVSVMRWGLSWPSSRLREGPKEMGFR